MSRPPAVAPAAPPLAHRLALALGHWPEAALAEALAQVSVVEAGHAPGGWSARMWSGEQLDLVHADGAWLHLRVPPPGVALPGVVAGRWWSPAGVAAVDPSADEPPPERAPELTTPSRLPPWVGELPVSWRAQGASVRVRRTLPADSFETALRLLRRQPDESVRAALASCPALSLEIASGGWVGLHVAAPPERVVAWVERAAADGALSEARERAALALGLRGVSALTVSGADGTCTPTWRVA